MILKKWSLAAIATLLVAPLSASALGVSVANVTTSGGTSWLEDGESITFDLLLENNSNVGVFGLGLGATGYEEGAVGSSDNHLVFTSGSNSSSDFNTVFVAGIDADGIQTSSGVTEQGNPNFPLFQQLRVQLYNAVSTTGATGDGSFDNGVGGGQTNGGDVHIQVTFTAQALGATFANPSTVSLNFGVGEFGNTAVGTGGSVLSFNNASYDVTVVPEPGTALLMGLGLLGLATRGRR
jgi:hypothetical protein